jgi:hypothetical protein
MKKVNTKDVEVETCLALAGLYDEGFPSIPHVHEPIDSPLESPSYGIPQERDPTPEECATNDAPLWE